jgi:hypothetical protein
MEGKRGAGALQTNRSPTTNMKSLRRRIQCMQSYLEQRRPLLRFDHVPDPRDPRGRRWRLGPLLSSALVSLTLLAPSLRRAEQLTEDLASSRLLRKLGIRRRVPDSTLGDTLAIVAPQAMLEQLHRQILAEHRRKALEPTRLPVRVLAIDGKVQSVHAAPLTPFYCQRQSAEGEPERYVYKVLNATLISSSAAVCVHQKPIPAWTNEMGYFEEFFDELCSAYARADLFDVVTSDAGVLSREHCGKLNALGKGYVVALKSNNPELEREARRVLEPIAARERPVAQDSGWEQDSSRGWIKRQLWTTTELAGWPGWEHLQQLWLMRVLVFHPEDERVEVLEERLYATNLRTAHPIHGEHILSLVRAHWCIENELHGTLDIELREDDRGWVRRGYGLMNTGLLRAMAYNLLAIARSVHLRTARLVGWQQLRDWLRDALLWPTQLAPECASALEVSDAPPA